MQQEENKFIALSLWFFFIIILWVTHRSP